MTSYHADDRVTLYLGDCRDVMASLEPCSVDAIVTDPPYGLEFMGKEWDKLWHSDDSRTRTTGRQSTSPLDGKPRYGTDTAAMQRWHESWAREALRVLKPGGHLLAFGATRTYHRLACAIEDAGFEVRDCLMWLYGSGFPKSLDVSKALDKAAGAEREIVGRRAKRGGVVATGNFRDDDWQPNADRLLAETAPATPDAERWQGWGTALKPAYEPVILARRPLAGTVAQNVLAYGTGGLNVDGCRIEAGDLKASDYDDSRRTSPKFNGRVYGVASLLSRGGATPAGRWPANLLLDEAAAALLDAQAGERDGASRFYYTAKASRSEREAGLEQTPTVKLDAWVSTVLKALHQADTVLFLRRVTEGFTTMDGCEWSMSSSGSESMGLSPPGSSYTTSTATSSTTASTTSSPLTLATTSAFIRDALSRMASGLSPADYVAVVSRLTERIGISPEKAGRSMDAAAAAISESLFALSEKGGMPSRVGRRRNDHPT